MYEDHYNSPMSRQRISIQQAQEIALQHIPGQVLHSFAYRYGYRAWGACL